MTNGRPKKRGRPRKVKPVPVGDFAPTRVRPDSPDFFEKMMEFVRWLVIRVVIATIIGLVAFFAIIASVEEPAIISPLGSEPGMPRGYRLIPISHPEVAHAEEIKPVVKTDASEDVEVVVRKYFGDIADKALTCFKSESGLRPTAINYSNRNGTWDIGLAQVNTIHCGKVGASNREDCKNKLLDLETNVRIAKQIYDGRGFNAWYGRTCKQFWK